MTPLLLTLCFAATLQSISLTVLCIILHILNYRKPLQQRLFVRILLIIPIYSAICYLNLVSSHTTSAIIEPIKEIYEAFVLYIFYCLLTHLLGGERSIIVNASGRPPVNQPFPMGLFSGPVDISDPTTFLSIKRSILQYVWLKPFLCLLFAIDEFLPVNEENPRNFLLSFGFWINLIYNISVSLSLYNLALFWKCLYGDLQQFNPWGKFLCVKLIIFASYWQGIILAILNYFNYLRESSFEIQNSLLCFELVGFAIGHWYSFNYKEFTIKYLGNSSRLAVKNALVDIFGFGDLIYDFKITFQVGSERYNFKSFQSVDVDSKVSQYDSETRLKKLNQGMRYSLAGGKLGTYWVDQKNANKTFSDDGDDTASLYSYNSDSRTLAETVDSRTFSGQGPGVSNGSSSSSQKKPKPKLKKPLTVNKKLKSQLAQEKQVSIIKKNTKELYKLNDASTQDILNSISLSKEEFLQDNQLYIRAIRQKPFGDENYPVIYDEIGYLYSNDMRKRRLEAINRQRIGRLETLLLGNNNGGGGYYGSVNNNSNNKNNEGVDGFYRV